MKKILTLILLFSQSFAWANNTLSDVYLEQAEGLGRSMANYQQCSQIAVDIDDQQMFFYYQKMLNDALLFSLSAKQSSAKQIYKAWGSSEKVLLQIGKENLQKVCLSRFDALARQLTKTH